MRIHHLNCATMCPFGSKLIHGDGGFFAPSRIVCHCLLIESDEGLILVDTGLGLGDLGEPARLGKAFEYIVRPKLDPAETALQHVERLGFKREDVRHIVLTHLDVDHAGGIGDFPQAHVHVLDREHEEATHPKTMMERTRYIQAQWAHGPRWAKHAIEGETWHGFESVQALRSNLTEVLLVPLHGHTRGHCGVAARGSDGWLLHCGDAYFFHGEMDCEQPRCPLGLTLLQWLLQMDRDARLHNQQRLRELVRDHGKDLQVFCAHDPDELFRCRKGVAESG